MIKRTLIAAAVLLSSNTIASDQEYLRYVMQTMDANLKAVELLENSDNSAFKDNLRNHTQTLYVTSTLLGDRAPLFRNLQKATYDLRAEARKGEINGGIKAVKAACGKCHGSW